VNLERKWSSAQVTKTLSPTTKPKLNSLARSFNRLVLCGKKKLLRLIWKETQAVEAHQAAE
jgi:hypothetical protein